MAKLERVRVKDGAFMRTRYFLKGCESWLGEIDWKYTIQWWLEKLLGLEHKPDWF